MLFVVVSLLLFVVVCLLLNILYTYKYCCWQGYPSTYCFSYVKPYVFKKVIIIANENGYPPERAFVLLWFFLGNTNNSKNAFMLCCSRAMNSN